MTLYDMKWSIDKRWYHEEGLRVIIHDDAPDDVKESYRHYCEQKKAKKKSGK